VIPASADTAFGDSLQPFRHARDRALTSIASLVAAGLILKAVTDMAYLTLMRDLYSAEAARVISTGSLLVSYLLTAVAAVVVAMDVALRPGPGNIVSLLYLSVVVIPVLSLFGFGAQYAEPGFVLSVLGCMTIVALVRLLVPAVRLPRPRAGARVVAWALLAAMAAYVYGALLVSGGIGRLNFDLSQVYEFRDELELAQFPFASYLIPWQAYVVNMILLAYFVHRGWKVAALGLLAAQLLLFGMTNYKAFLFAPVLVLGVLWLARSSLQLGWVIVLGAAAVLLAAWGIYLVSDEVLIPAIFVRRLFFVPAELHLWYFDFFSTPGNPFVALSNSVLAAFSPYPYDQPVPLVIGWAYTGAELGANAGWMADAYAQFGFPGMAVFAVLLAVVLRVVDGISAGTSRQLATAAIAVPAMALVNSGLLTVLLTHGLGLAGLLLWLLGDDGRSRS
jgi:hypothetical protein